MVRAGGSASRIIGDRSATDPGGGIRTWGGGAPASLATTIGGRPWIFMDPRCPGLSDTGEPLFDEGVDVVRAHGQQSSGRGDPRRPPGIVDRPVTNISALELLEHSVLGEDLDSRPMEGLSVPEPLEHLVPVETLDGRPMEGLLVPEPLEHPVLDEVLDGGPMEGSPDPGPLEHSVPEVILERSSRKELSALEPLEHSVPDVVLERSSGKELSALEPLEHLVPAGPSNSKHRGRIAMGPLEHSVPGLALLRTVDPFPERTAPDPLDHLGLPGKEVEGRRSVSLQPLEHSVLGTPQDQWDVSSAGGL